MDTGKAIDPGRATLGKSLLGGTGAFQCERQHYYEERVRLPNGWRVRRLMPEKVHFGKAVDVAHAQAVKWLREGASVEDVQDRVPRLVEMAYYAGLQEQPWADDNAQPYTPTDEDKAVFWTQLSNAILILVGAAPNRLPKGMPEPEQPIPLLQLPIDGVHVQGMDGQTLEVPGVFGERALGCTPDYVYTDPEGTLVGWLDVKCTDRAYSYPTQWHKAEAVIYTYALLRLNEGVPPTFAGYQEYRRNAKPYWATTWIAGMEIGALARLAERYVLRWRKALEVDDPDLLQFNTKDCRKCVFRDPVPDTTHTGCPIGQAVADIGLEEPISD